ncbi:hypothetical protein NDR87_36055 [Nocardia sp. CDC159]|uniref:Uncharacterized protein n=1 Tax=Nocardia pulmonis TaxID=2951408 RepID=A0A9X2EDH7_9NOCA|nr:MULTISPECIES: hypothetical protein [Nocardia]MCM6778902.1 hypothetical protein [Nocardia pulmonis]MCM6791791.1 hypothetical protein [Nocardia sp. CDC159]
MMADRRFGWVVVVGVAAMISTGLAPAGAALAADFSGPRHIAEKPNDAKNGKDSKNGKNNKDGKGKRGSEESRNGGDDDGDSRDPLCKGTPLAATPLCGG